MRFTFKTEKSIGKYRSFYPDSHLIKLNKKEVGLIEHKSPHHIRLMVVKSDINEDGNPNCKWKWITLKKKSKVLQEAKDFLNEYYYRITDEYKLYSTD